MTLDALVSSPHSAALSIVWAIAVALVLSVIIAQLARRGSPYELPFRNMRSLLLPTALLLYLCKQEFNLGSESIVIKLGQTLVGIEAIWVLLSIFKTLIVTHASDERGQLKISGLFVDILRFTFVVIGSGIVIAVVWHHDVGNVLATLGVGSLVVGLALQETLGNLFAGIAVAFERPFSLGDWIQVGDLVGEVIETNWRAVRLRTRSLDCVVVPNSTLGRERIYNYSRPSKIHGTTLQLGFSYNDPPNKVKSVLMELLLNAPGVLPIPAPVIRTKSYADFSIGYEVRFFIDQFERLLDIEAEVLTRVWYASRRYGLSIPFPIQTVFETKVPPPPVVDDTDRVLATIDAVPLFAPLTEHEQKTLASRVLHREFAQGEHIVRQGEIGDSLYIIERGNAVVVAHDSSGAEHRLFELKAGDFFGEMALLTGEPRSATVTAQGDLSVLVIAKAALAELLSKRPEMAAQMAEIATQRRAEISQSVTVLAAGGEQKKTAEAGVLARIREFFALS